MADRKIPSQADVESYFKRLNNWGRWGHDDQLGTANLITDARRAAARALVKKNRTVSLARDIVPQPHLQYGYPVTVPSKRERLADGRVVDGQDLVARQREQVLDAGRHQRVDEQRGAGGHQKMASGCAGAPVAPTSRIGVAVKRNS